MTLEFYEKSHRYKLDGRWVPGVTTLVRKGLPNDALKYWSARTVAEWVADNPAGVAQLRTMGRAPMVAALKEIPWQERDTAAERGKEVHAYAVRSIHGEDVDVPDDLYDYVQAYADWLDAENVKPLHTEQLVANRALQYGGRFDLICEYRAKRILGDVKTGGVYESAAVQLVGYEHAEFMLIDDAEIPMPSVDMLAAIHVAPDGVDVIPIKDEDREHAWESFQSIAATGKARDRIKDYFGQPLPRLNELPQS